LPAPLVATASKLALQESTQLGALNELMTTDGNGVLFTVAEEVAEQPFVGSVAVTV
jgi:hypothetical protein